MGRKARQDYGDEEAAQPRADCAQADDADRLLAEGKDTAAVRRELGVSEGAYHRWRNQFGGLRAEGAKRVEDLERENGTINRVWADAELEKAALKEIARRNF